MLLSNAYVVKAFGILFGKVDQSGSIRHGGGDGDDPWVIFCQFTKCIAKDTSVRRGAGLFWCALPAAQIKGLHTVLALDILVDAWATFTLFSTGVDDHRAIQAADVLECLREHLHIVAVDRSDVFEAQALKQQPRTRDNVFGGIHHVLEVADDISTGCIESAEKCTHAPAPACHTAADEFATEPLGQRADVGADRHSVVIDDDDQITLEGARVVERFERHAAGHPSIADDRDDFSTAVFETHGFAHACGRGKGR